MGRTHLSLTPRAWRRPRRLVHLECFPSVVRAAQRSAVVAEASCLSSEILPPGSTSVFRLFQVTRGVVPNHEARCLVHVGEASPGPPRITRRSRIGVPHPCHSGSIRGSKPARGGQALRSRRLINLGYFLSVARAAQRSAVVTEASCLSSEIFPPGSSPVFRLFQVTRGFAQTTRQDASSTSDKPAQDLHGSHGCHGSEFVIRVTPCPSVVPKPIEGLV